MVKQGRINRIACAILLITIVLTLIFIFGNSMASKEESQEISDKVTESVEEVVETITGKEDTALEDFISKNSRKIAHFLEFAFLGLQVVLFCHFAGRHSASYLILGCISAFMFASFDEGIQMFTGRGDQVKDIFIDVAGYITAYLLGMLVLYIFVWRKASRKTATL